MKLFLGHILKIILGALFLTYLLEPVLDHGLNSLTGSVYEEWNHIVKGEINADLIVMGSSRGVVGYDPMILEQKLGYSCYNLGFDAASYNLQYAKLDAYLLNNKMPHIIIQNIDLAHFSESTEIPYESQFLTTLNSDNVDIIYHEISGSLTKFRFKGVTKYTVDSRKIKLSIFNLLGFSPNYSKKYKGYHAMYKPYIPDVYNLNRLSTVDLESKLKGLFETVEFYKNKRFDNTQVYFVWAPEYIDRRVLTHNVSIDIKEMIMNEIHMEDKLTFIDLQTNQIGESSSNFYDSFHLNASGSKIFSHKLADILNQ